MPIILSHNIFRNVTLSCIFPNWLTCRVIAMLDWADEEMRVSPRLGGGVRGGFAGLTLKPIDSFLQFKFNFAVPKSDKTYADNRTQTAYPFFCFCWTISWHNMPMNSVKGSKTLCNILQVKVSQQILMPKITVGREEIFGLTFTSFSPCVFVSTLFWNTLVKLQQIVAPKQRIYLFVTGKVCPVQ